MTTRQERVRQACDQLVEEAIATGNASLRPTVSILRERFGIRGSQNDLQQDVHAWHMQAYRHHLEAGRIDGIPPQLVTSFQSFWQIAQNEANASLSSERQVIRTSNEQMQGTLEILIAEKAEAWAAHGDLERQISDMEDVAKDRESRLTDAKASVIAKDERIQNLNDHIASLIQSHGVEIARIQGEASSKIQELEDARKYAITQIDIAREAERQLRAANKELQTKLDGAHSIETALRQRAIGAESDLASVKAVQEVLKSRLEELEAIRDTAVGQLAVLNANLETERAGRQALVAENEALKVDGAKKQETIQTLQSRVSDLEGKLFAQKR